MKTIKKAFAMLLAVVMVLGLSVTAFAASDGSITISNATVGQTYEVYKVFDLTYEEKYTEATYDEGSTETYYTYDKSTGAYTEVADPSAATEQLYVKGYNVSYTITATSDNSALISALQGEGTVFTLTASDTNKSVYVVTLKSDYAQDGDGENITATDDQVIAFVKSIADKLGDPVATKKAESEEVKFENLDYGYYYITSTLGTLVTIDSTLKDVSVKDKNTAPSNEKTVEEDSNNQYGSSNTADLGDTVNFKSTITAYAGAEGYVLHDTMSTGLSFDSTSVKVTVGETTLTAGTDYTLVTTGLTDGCTFEVKFTDTYLNSITAQTTIVVSYSATVNGKAGIGNDGNSNSSNLEYGDDATTTTSTTTTYVYAFDLLKYSGTDADDNKITLDGAEFTLTRSGETEALYFVKSTKTVGEETVTVYTLAKSTDEGASQTITAGKITIEGLDAGTYTLAETKAPNGYNLLAKSVAVVIGQNTEGTTPTMTLTQDGETANEIEVLNQSGSELPETGGIGTTIFYVVGAILVIGAAVLLVVKKRMSGTRE